ncbi:MAG: hypothetical protein WCT46_04385 [Candidatus Gracilibacteria bacterium]
MDSINPQPTTSPEILAAIEQVKQWQKDGKTDNAMQGCKEILEIDPQNTEAKTILSSLEKPIQPTVSQPIVPPTTTQQQPTPDYEITTPENPLYNVLTKSNPVTKTPEKKSSHGILLNLGIVVGTLAILGGIAYGYLTFFGNKTDTTVVDLPEENIVIPTEDDNLVTDETNTETTTTESDARNEQRFADLTEIETAIKDYYTQNGKYPDAIALATLIPTMPYDPMDGETDENGQVFAYSYAVYDTDLENQEYILAGLLEDENGENTIWTTGADPQDHTDYRDGTAENFIMIMTQTETEEDSGPKVKVKR